MLSAPVRILLVEDDPASAELTRHHLLHVQGERYQVDWVDTYGTAQERLSTGDYDVYLLDHQLGERTALELLDEMKPDLSKVPAILLLDCEITDIDTKALERGIFDYLLKAELTSRSIERSIRYATTHARVNARFREHEEQFRRVFWSSPLAISISALADGRFMEVNPTFCNLAGRTQAEVLGKTSVELNFWLQSELREKSLEELMRAGRMAGREQAYLHANGEIRWMLSNSEIIDYQDQKAILNLATDITERKLAEANLFASRDALAAALDELSRAKDNLSALIENTHDGIWSIDSQYRLVTYNSVYAQVMREHVGLEIAPGYDMRNAGRSDEERQIWLELCDRALRGERFIQKIGFGSPATGTAVVQFEFYPVVRGEKVTGVVVYQRDISERVQLETQLLRAKETAEEMNRLKSSFLANMSHEIRTPLTAILGYSSMLSEELTLEPYRSYSEVIVKSGQRLMETMDSIIDFAQVEARAFELSSQRVDINDEVRIISERFRKRAEEKNLELIVLQSREETCTYLDLHAFTQIISNLISNGIKFTSRGSVVVRISTEKHERKSWIRIEVKDTGIGISAEFLPKVFDEFLQESTGYSRRFEGTGLGLTISKRLATLMGGILTAESTPGIGSTFLLKLPVLESMETMPIAGRNRHV